MQVNMFRTLLVLSAIIGAYASHSLYPKCCDSDSVLQKINGTYNCTEGSLRTQMIVNRTNFLNSLEEGYCVDVEGSTSLFQVNGSDLYKVKDLDVDFYPKCCPLDYFYNSTTHGCVKSDRELKRFFKETFVKVGLPQCKVIEDILINNHNFVDFFDDPVYLNKNRKIYGDKQHCVDKDQNNSLVVRICHENYYDVCDRIRCVRKCCPDGQSYVNGSKCKDTYVHGLDFSSFSANMENVNDRFVVVYEPLKSEVYALSPQRFHFYLNGDGIFTMSEVDESLGKINITRHYGVDKKAYCVEHAVKKSSNINKYLFFRKFPEQSTQIKFVYTGTAMAISCVFLLLTVLYYCISDEKKTLFGKLLISYCWASFMAFLTLSYFAFDGTRPDKGSGICIMFAFIILYLTQSIVTWMNVMCIDIYCTFGSPKSFSSSQHRSKDMKKFVLLSIHGWGTPLLLTVIPLIFYYERVIPSAIQVIIDEQKCFLYRGDGNYAQFLFSTIPIAILQLCNLVLFVKTALYCLQVKKEINRMNDTHTMKGEKRRKFNKFRDRFGLLLKLFFIMGISFLFEVASTFYDFKKTDVTAVIEIIWDTFNCLQGLFIFLIFLVKKRIFKKLEKKVGLKKLRKISLVSSALTQTTSLPGLSK